MYRRSLRFGLLLMLLLGTGIPGSDPVPQALADTASFQNLDDAFGAHESWTQLASFGPVAENRGSVEMRFDEEVISKGSPVTFVSKGHTLLLTGTGGVTITDSLAFNGDLPSNAQVYVQPEAEYVLRNDGVGDVSVFRLTTSDARAGGDTSEHNEFKVEQDSQYRLVIGRLTLERGQSVSGVRLHGPLAYHVLQGKVSETIHSGSGASHHSKGVVKANTVSTYVMSAISQR